MRRTCRSLDSRLWSGAQDRSRRTGCSRRLPRRHHGLGRRFVRYGNERRPGLGSLSTKEFGVAATSGERDHPEPVVIAGDDVEGLHADRAGGSEDHQLADANHEVIVPLNRFARRNEVLHSRAVVDYRIRRANGTDPAVVELAAAQQGELAVRYGATGDEVRSRPQPDLGPDAHWLLLTADGVPAGVVAIRPLAASHGRFATGEVKRLYVAPSSRGRGCSRLLMAAVEDLALQLGYDTLWLETGTAQPEAVGLYSSAGWTPIQPYGQWRDSPASLAFAKSLAKVSAPDAVGSDAALGRRLPAMTNLTGGPALPQERRLLTALPGPKSIELMSRRTAAVSSGVGGTLTTFVAAAGGGVIVDVDGNSLIDLGSGIAVTGVGNSAPHVVERVQEQVAAFTHTCFMVVPYEGYVAVCERLNELTPGSHEKRSALFNSGAEAVENAVKIARAYTRRAAVVVFEHGYHGRTNLTMALTAKNMPYKHSFGPFAPEVYRVPMSYPFHDGLSGADAAAAAISRIDKEVGAANVAAIVIEPIQGEGGFVVPAKGFLPAIVEFARANGIVFVADEIQTGFARTGAWFACEDESIVPDLITTAKGIAGGLPLAAVTGRAQIMDSVHVGGLGGTYGGNPIACAAAVGAIETMIELDLPARARHIEQVMRPVLERIAEKSGIIGDIRGRGAMIAVEVVRAGTSEPDAAATSAIAKACHEQGVLVLTAGTYGNVLRFLPPMVIGDDLLLEGLSVLEDAFLAVAG